MIRLTIAALVLAAVTAAATLLPTQEMPQATPQHAMLLKGVGEWEGTMVMHMPGEAEEPVACRESVTAIGEFWTTSTFHSDFGGVPFVGTGVTGYDPDRKLFVGTWVDSMTTRLSVMEGKWDEAKRALVMSYMGPDPMTGELVPHRAETVHAGDGYTSTFFMGAGEGTKSMTIKMKRVK